eukprot:SAG11_NODE_1418_length_4962_cov_3.782644_2_plen_252_part_00
MGDRVDDILGNLARQKGVAQRTPEEATSKSSGIKRSAQNAALPQRSESARKRQRGEAGRERTASREVAQQRIAEKDVADLSGDTTSDGEGGEGLRGEQPVAQPVNDVLIEETESQNLLDAAGPTTKGSGQANRSGTVKETPPREIRKRTHQNELAEDPIEGSQTQRRAAAAGLEAAQQKQVNQDDHLRDDEHSARDESQRLVEEDDQEVDDSRYFSAFYFSYGIYWCFWYQWVFQYHRYPPSRRYYRDCYY